MCNRDNCETKESELIELASCESCGCEVHLDDARCSDDGETFCETCYYEAFTSCESCYCEISVDECICRGDGTYCQNCAPAQCEEFDSGDDIDSETFTRTLSARRFGVELETSCCDCDGDDIEALQWGCQHDGSISGMEFVSPILQGDDGLASIEDVCEALRHCEVDHKCGFHLHIDIRDLSPEERRKVAMAYCLTYRAWSAFVSDSRRRNAYCTSHPSSWIDSLYISWQAFRSNLRGGRYWWTNWSSPHGTVEIRLHSGTIDGAKVTNWAIAHCRFVDRVRGMFFNDILQLRNATPQQQFDFLCETWRDDRLAAFYRDRAAHFGTEFDTTTAAHSAPQVDDVPVALASFIDS